MRVAASLVAVLLSWTAAPAAAQPATHSEARCGYLWDGVIPAGVYLQGTIDSRVVRGWLTHGEPVDAPERVHGVLIDDTAWRPGGKGAAAARGFGGLVREGCRLELSETDDTGELVATWDVRLDAEGVAGDRRRAGSAVDGGVSRVRLGRGRAPDCDGRNGWRTFRSGSWPMTFRYPVTWRIVDSVDRLLLQCPDPGRLAAGDTPITFLRPVTGDDAAPARRAGPFYSRDGRTWFHGFGCPGDEPGSPFCAATRQSVRGGLTIVQAGLPDQQLYAPGRGYIGLGPGLLRYLFLSDGSAVLLDAPDAPGWVGRFGAPGPVRFDGSGAGLRIARSVSPRESRGADGR